MRSPSRPFCRVPLGAQGFKWWQSDRHKRELGLTPEQSRRLEGDLPEPQPTLKAQKQALDLAEGRFESSSRTAPIAT